MGRIISIDVLRGIMALSVMFYHFFSWSLGGLDADNVLSRFGLYAVTIFYLISGYSLAYVYWERDFNLLSYLSSRLFRIAPLFYFVSLIFFIGSLSSGFDVYRFILNFSLLFSFVDSSAYYATGAWSIGNEIVFYCVLAFILSRKSRDVLLIAIMVLSLLFFLVFRFYYISSGLGLSEQWALYVNPLNHLFAFMLGIFFYRFKLINHLKQQFFFILLVPLALLIFTLDYSGDRVVIATDWPSVFMMISSFSIFLVFLGFERFFVGKRVLVFFGDISYSVYLVHPITWKLFSVIIAMLGIQLGLHEKILFGAMFTVIACYLTYNYIELPFMKLGKKISFKSVK